MDLVSGNDFRIPSLPGAAVFRRLAREAGGTRGRLHLRGVVARREMDIPGSPGGRPKPLVASAFSRWSPGTDHVRRQRRSRHRQNAVWIHDSRGDRALSIQGYADSKPPVFSRDGKRLYYLLRRDSPDSPAELRRADLASGGSEIILPGVSISAYDISDDEKEVVFSTQPPGQASQIWIAPLDRSAPPRRIASNGESLPHFGSHNEIVFRLTDGQAYYVGAMASDGTDRRKAFPGRILNFGNVSPDRRFVLVTAVMPNITLPQTVAFPLDGRPAIPICNALCSPTWSPDGRYLYLQIPDKSGQNSNARTVAIPIPAGGSLPHVPPEKVHDAAEWARVPGVRIIQQTDIVPGLDPSTYAYIKASTHANLFRIPVSGK
jgi:hypothetical protein